MHLIYVLTFGDVLDLAKKINRIHTEMQCLQLHVSLLSYRGKEKCTSHHFENVEITIKFDLELSTLQSVYSTIYQGQPKSTVHKSHSISLHVHQIN